MPRFEVGEEREPMSALALLAFKDALRVRDACALAGLPPGTRWLSPYSVVEWDDTSEEQTDKPSDDSPDDTSEEQTDEPEQSPSGRGGAKK